MIEFPSQPYNLPDEWNPQMDFYRPHRPHACRRAKFHNYKAPGHYLITLSKEPSAPYLSQLAGIPWSASDPPRVNLSPAGLIIEKELAAFDAMPEFEIPKHVIMPDHLHFLLRVTKWLDEEVGYEIGRFKSRCTASMRGTRRNAEDNAPFAMLKANESLFMPKFNDRIAFDDSMISRFANYVDDNPRRRLIAMWCPDLFRRASRIKIKDTELEIFGNFQLLKHPLLASGVVSSRYTAEEKAYYERRWEEVIRGAGVMVSPFISQAEKALMNRCISEGGSIIRIVASGIGPKYKPYGEEFELCAEGRCLHIGLPNLSGKKIDVKRNYCLDLNQLAYWIEQHSMERMSLLDEAVKERFRGK